MSNYNNFGRNNLQFNRQNNSGNINQPSFGSNTLPPRGNSGFHMLNDRMQTLGTNNSMREQSGSVGMNGFNRIPMQNFGGATSNFMNPQGNRNVSNSGHGLMGNQQGSMSNQQNPMNNNRMPWNNRNISFDEGMGMGSSNFGFAKGFSQSGAGRSFGSNQLPTNVSPSRNNFSQLPQQTNEINTSFRGVLGSNSYNDSIENQNNVGHFGNNPNQNSFSYGGNARGNQDFIQTLSAQRFVPSINNFMLNRAQEEEEMNLMARNRNNVNSGYVNSGNMNYGANNRQEEVDNFGRPRNNKNISGFYRQSSSNVLANNNQQNLNSQGYYSNQNRFNSSQNSFNNSNQGFNNNPDVTRSSNYGNVVQNRAVGNNANGGGFFNGYANPNSSPIGSNANNSYNYQAGNQSSYNYINNKQQDNEEQQPNEFDWLNDSSNQLDGASKEYTSYSSGDYASKYDNFEESKFASMYGGGSSSGSKSKNKGRNEDFDEDEDEDEDYRDNKKNKGSSFLSLFKKGKKKKKSDDLSFFDDEEDEWENRSAKTTRRKYLDEEEDIDDEDDFGNIFGVKSKAKSKTKKHRKSDDYDDEEDYEDDFDDIFGVKSKAKSKTKKHRKSDDYEDEEDYEDDFDDIFGIKSKSKTKKHRKSDDYEDEEDDEYDFDSVFGGSKGKGR